MHKILALITFSISLSIFGQTPCGDSITNWHLEKGNIHTSIGFQIPDNDSIPDDSITSVYKLLYFFNSKKGVENIVIKGNTIDFHVYNIVQDFTKYGYRKKDLSYFMYYPLSFHCSIEPQAGKYIITYSQIIWNLNAQLSSDKVILNFDYFNKNNCITYSHKKNLTNELKMLRSLFEDWSQLNQANTIINMMETFPVKTLPNLSPEAVTPSPEFQYQLIAKAGHSYKKALNNRIESALFLGAGSVFITLGNRNGSMGGVLVGGASMLLGIGCGISSLVWEYRAANYLIKVAPNGVKIEF